jgi:hypothetical protein
LIHVIGNVKLAISAARTNRDEDPADVLDERRGIPGLRTAEETPAVGRQS